MEFSTFGNLLMQLWEENPVIILIDAGKTLSTVWHIPDLSFVRLGIDS